jgi:hypothetical protein
MSMKRADEIRCGDRRTDGGGTEWLVKEVGQEERHGHRFIRLTLDPMDRNLLLNSQWRNKVELWLPSTRLKIH